MTSHEFKIHHLTSQLLQLLQLQYLSPDTYNDTLMRHMTPYVTTQVSSHNSLKKIAEHSLRKEDLLQRYSSLKIKQPRELDALVYLLSKLLDDPELCNFIRQRRPVSKPREPVQVVDFHQLDVPKGVAIPELPKPGEKLSHEQLAILKGQLATFTKKMEEEDRKKKQKKEIISGEFPYLPPWFSSRTYLTSDYTPSLTTPTKVPLGSLPLNVQQHAIINDLLYLMQGTSGIYLSAKPLQEDQRRLFSMDHTLDVSLQTLVNRMLPICSHYSVISRFVEEHAKFVHGTVNQALSAAMRGLVREYLVIVAQLEYQYNSGELTLHKMWYYIQPIVSTMDVLARIASTVNKARHCHGGRTLTLLHTMTTGLMGDPRAQRVAEYLTKLACVPFFDMLRLWLHSGEVRDPYNEFMIIEDKEIGKGSLHEEYNDYFWERKYVASQENIPVFLELAAERILQTGKYLNVVLDCGRELESPQLATDMEYSLNERYYVEQVDAAYNHASRQLLDVIIKEYDLLGYLQSMKHYFLLDQGDFLVHFLDTAGDELLKPIGLIPISRLESLMELALRTSVANSDPYKDNLRILLEPYNLKMFLRHVISVQPEQLERGASPPSVTRPASSTALPGYECISIDYTVKWPLSLVISRRCLTRYQLIFRHIFSSKYVERELSMAWKAKKDRHSTRTRPNNGRIMAFALLQRMLNFIQGLQYYMSYEVLEPNWRYLERKISEVKTIDEVLERHTDFLDRCLKDCLLTNREFVELMSRLLQHCLDYATYMQGAIEITNRSVDEIKTHEQNFTQDLSALLGILNDLSKIESERSWTHIVAILDYNSFYGAS